MIMSLMTIGCSNKQPLSSDSLFLQTKISSAGGVCQSLGFPTFREELLQSYEESQVESYLKKLKNEIEQKVYNAYFIKYALIYLQQPVEKYKIGGDVVQFSPPFVDGERVVISFNFLTQDAWRFYNKQKGSGLNSKDDAFISTLKTRGVFPFNQKTETGDYQGEYYSNLVKDCIGKSFPKFNISLLEFEFEYRYETPYLRLHSNADNVVSTEEGKLHSWSISEKCLNQDKTIEIWIKEANRGWWYLLALIAMIVVSVAIFVILSIKGKKRIRELKNANPPKNKEKQKNCLKNIKK